jgi:ATP/maltotriose-dependent transcriptional regulator MalT
LVLHTRGDAPKAVATEVAELERIATRTGNTRAHALARYGRLELMEYGTGTVAEADVDDAINAVAAVGGTEFVVTLQLISIGTAIGRGEHGVAGRRVERVIELARAANLPMLEALPTVFYGLAQFQNGAWDSALALADRGLVLAHRFTVPRGIALALAVRAMVLLHRGEVAEAESCVDEAAANYRDRRLGRLLDMIAAQIALARGDLAKAAAVVPRSGPFAFPVLHLGVRAELCLLAGDHGAVAAVLEELDAFDFPYAAAVADRLRGLVAGKDGARLLAEATDAFDALGLTFDAASCRLDQAKALAQADQDAAIVVATRAMAVFDNLDAVPMATQARRLLRRWGARPKPRERGSGTLSARETEVAVLVAQGLSNAAVAAQLFLSPRTVTTHLDNIYRRLGLSSRRELARYIAEHATNT